MAEAVLPHLKSVSPAIREATARTLAALLNSIPEAKPPRGQAAGPPEPSRLQTDAAQALAIALVESGPDLAARVAVIDALGSAGGPAIGRTPAALAWLNAEKPATTFAEAAARLGVLGKVPAPRRTDDVTRSYEALLLDAKIDTDEAASALWPHIDEETDLSSKLRLIALLGRHGFRDGYAQAIEHLATRSPTRH